MSDKNLSKEIEEALSYLDFTGIPSMKELNTRYRRLALLKHPDKNGGSDIAKEDYQKLQMYYKLVGNVIVERDTSVHDDEERDHVKAFKTFNFDQKNKFCHTILIENKLSTAWKQVLSDMIGQPESKGKNGLIFRVSDFSVNNELFTITVTLYEAPKDNKPKLHIQSSSQLANDEFALKELPVFYQEVRKNKSPEMFSVGASVGSDVDEDSGEDVAKKGKRTSGGRPTKKTAKSIRTVKDVVKYCQVKSCHFTTKLKKDMNVHSKTHSRDETVNLQRNITVEETDNEMETVDDEEENVAENMNAPAGQPFDFLAVQPFDFVDSQVVMESRKEKEKIKLELDEKNKIIGELREKVTAIEGELEKERKKFQKEEELREKDLYEMKSELNRALGKASTLCEENTLLREQIKTFQNHEIANAEIQRKYEDRLKVKLATTGCQTEEHNEAEDIEVLCRNKVAGFKRSDPASPPTAILNTNVVSNEEHNCNLCNFKSNSEERLNKHRSLKHHECDICNQTLRTHALLRSHLREIHDKENGTMIKCNKCEFSALNEKHLNMHVARHHAELACNRCEFKTFSRRSLMDHVAGTHRRTRNVTCRYWLQNNCRREHCQYKHEKVRCKFGRNCDRRNCQFDHDLTQQNTVNSNQPQISPWINPAYLSRAAADESFPFLEKNCLCRGQNRRQGM